MEDQYEVLVIDVDKFIENHEDVKDWWDKTMQYEFVDYDSYRNFFIEVGTNHPDGVPLNYLTELLNYYTTTSALKHLVEEGILEEIIDEDGELAYKKAEGVEIV